MTLSKSGKTITVFGSSSPREGSEAYNIAYRLGAALARCGFSLCNGGYGGTMEATAKGVKEAGGKTMGAIFASSGAANPWIEEAIECSGLTERITTLTHRGDGYAVLPGGTGTLAEVGMLLEMMNKRLLPLRPVVFVGKTWDPLLEILSEEPILKRKGKFKAVPEVELTGLVARTDSPEAAAEFFVLNVL